MLNELRHQRVSYVRLCTMNSNLSKLLHSLLEKIICGHRRRSSVNFRGGHNIFAQKICMRN